MESIKNPIQLVVSLSNSLKRLPQYYLLPKFILLSTSKIQILLIHILFESLILNKRTRIEDPDESEMNFDVQKIEEHTVEAIDSSVEEIQDKQHNIPS